MKKFIAMFIAVLCLASILPISALAADTYVVYIRFAFMKSESATTYSNLYYVSGSGPYSAKTSSSGTAMYNNAPKTYTVSGYTCTSNSYTGSSGDIGWKFSKTASFTAKDVLPTSMSTIGSIASGYELAGTYYATSAADVRAAQIKSATTWDAVRSNASSASAISSYSSSRYFYICFKPTASAATPTPTVAPTAAPTATPVPTATPQPAADCQLKVWASTGATSDSPSYNAPFTTMIRSGQSYTWLSPEKYGIYAAEGYEFDYYYDNAQRSVGSQTYVASNLQGWSAVAFFKQKTVDKNIAIKFVDENNELVETVQYRIEGKYFENQAINLTDIFDGTTAKANGYTMAEGQQGIVQVKPGQVDEITVNVVAPVPYAPPEIVFVGQNIAFADENADVSNIKLIYAAKGEWNTLSEMTAAGKKTLNKDNLKYSIPTTVIEPTVYTFYFKVTLDTGVKEFFVHNTYCPVVPAIEATQTYIMPITNTDDIVEMRVCLGIYTSYSLMFSERATNNYKNVTNDPDMKYTKLRASENNEFYTCHVKMSDGSNFYITVIVPPTKLRDFDLDWYGVKYSVPEDIREYVLTTAGSIYSFGTYSSWAEMKADKDTNGYGIASSLEHCFKGITDPTAVTVIVRDIYGEEYVFNKTLEPLDVRVVKDGNTIKVVGNDTDEIVRVLVAKGEFTVNELSNMLAATPHYEIKTELQVTVESGVWSVRVATQDGNVVCHVLTID